ncbi:gliding motility lipoprotein GldH [Flavobacterium orientale]|uniref:Gliding motility lipoprotein GldH n=1 Tax=Flavobacterium orientale TaxID=1756020 RepID=A0A916XYK8_9FLAO|nr:gliding motility lipoprotein GldH [Flavobacterium orientale]GGD21876.1 gliding motility lipoprotein GldH [Flavobacterium orientale]
MNLKSSFVLILLVILVVSCDKKRVFDRYDSVGKTWHKDSIVTFSFEQKDTVALHNLFLNLRNNKNYPYSNLFLIVELEDPNQKTIVDTLEYIMANPDGTLLGSGFSDTKENKLYYKEKYQFKKPGNYTVRIQHAVRNSGKISGVETLEGILDVGFRIELTE